MSKPETEANVPAEVDKDLGFFGGPVPVWTSLDKSKPEDKAMILRAARGVDMRAEDLGKEAFSIVHILAQRVSIAQKDGTFNDAVRVVLISPEKKTLGFVSEGIRKDLGLIMQLYGKPPYSPPIKVKVVPVRTRQGFRMYSLEIA